jgi:hypothetical protein
MEVTVPACIAVFCVAVVVLMYWGGFVEEKRNSR